MYMYLYFDLSSYVHCCGVDYIAVCTALDMNLHSSLKTGSAFGPILAKVLSTAINTW